MTYKPNEIKNADERYVAATYARFPVELVSGAGARVTDAAGKEYIDMGSGIAVSIFGHCDEQWREAVTGQLSQLAHTSNLYYSAPCAQLAEMLCARTGAERVFFSNSGAEANECAIKAVRRRAFRKYGEGHSSIITLKNSFHGRTLATLAATGQDSFHTEFGPFPEGFIYADPADPQSLERLAAENGCCAVMIETVQGEGGVLPLTPEFVAQVAATAREHDLMIVCDEVQTGNGRTGKLYGYMNYDLQPDVITTAKGLAGGLPLGATMLFGEMADIFTPGSHGSTFGGNPVCCAGAISVLSRLDETLLSGVCERSEYIIKELTGAPGVISVTGMGLMLGIQTVRPAKEIIAGCIEKGVLVISAKNKVRLLPPLNIGWDDLKTAVTILKEELAK